MLEIIILHFFKPLITISKIRVRATMEYDFDNNTLNALLPPSKSSQKTKIVFNDRGTCNTFFLLKYATGASITNGNIMASCDLEGKVTFNRVSDGAVLTQECYPDYDDVS